eukprot:10136094-Lingulodinium_polyedra.AAC.1
MALAWIYRLQHRAREEGGHLAWTTEIINPGRHPGMRGHDAEALATHTLRARGSHTADQLLHETATGRECGAPSVWGPDDWREAVVLPVPRGAIP